MKNIKKRITGPDYNPILSIQSHSAKNHIFIDA